MNSVKGLFKLHFVAAFSCLIMSSVFGVRKDIKLITTDGEVFVFQGNDELLEKSLMFKCWVHFNENCNGNEDDLMIPRWFYGDDCTYFSISSEFLRETIEISRLNEMQINESVLMQLHDYEKWACILNLANYLILEEMFSLLAKVLIEVATKSNIKKILVGLDRDAYEKFCEIRNGVVSQKELDIQQYKRTQKIKKKEKIKCKKIQKQRSIERRQARQNRFRERMYFLLAE